MKPTRYKFTILHQVMSILPIHLVSKISRQYGIDKIARSFTPWSHVVSMVFGQISHALSLNDICDTLWNHSSALFTIRGACPPRRNTLSHANRTRNAQMAESLFWETLGHLQQQFPRFGFERKYKGFPRRFKRIINIVDSTTIQLIGKCIDWARHRRRKAAAKCHMRLDAQTFLPRFAIVRSAGSHDAKNARELCADIRSGEIVIFDKAYIDFKHLNDLTNRGIFWVSRAKENMSYTINKFRNRKHGYIISDIEIFLDGLKSSEDYPEKLRLVDAWIEIDGVETLMSFLTNNFEWSPASICELYNARWGIEVFFKEIKQTLQLSDFLGNNENAVRWQIWTALLAYVLLRFIKYMHAWKNTFPRLFTMIRGVLWSRFDLKSVLHICCGTAGVPPKVIAQPQQLYLPLFT